MIHTCAACQIELDEGVYVLTPVLGGVSYEETWYHYTCVNPEQLQDRQMYRYLNYRLEKLDKKIEDLRQDVQDFELEAKVSKSEVLDIVREHLKWVKFYGNSS